MLNACKVSLKGFLPATDAKSMIPCSRSVALTLAVGHSAVSGVIQIRFKRLYVGDHPVMVPSNTTTRMSVGQVSIS